MQLNILIDLVSSVFDDGLFDFFDSFYPMTDCFGIGVRNLIDFDDISDVVVVAKVDYNLGIVCMVDRIGRLGIFPLCTFVAVDGVLRVDGAFGALQATP